MSRHIFDGFIRLFSAMTLGRQSEKGLVRAQGARQVPEVNDFPPMPGDAKKR